MISKVSVFLVVIFLGSVLFLAGYLVAQRSTLNEGEGQLALVDNSLVSRFNKTEEKYIKNYGIIKIANDEGAALRLGVNGKEIIYYLPESGQIRSVPISNIESRNPIAPTLVAETRPGLKAISWSPDGKGIIALDNVSFNYFNLISGTVKKLDRRIKNPVFPRTGDKIVYLFFDPENGQGSISIADPAIENFKSILKTRSDDWSLSWFDDKTISLINDQGSLFLLTIQSGGLEKILDNQEGLEAKWSPNGQRLVYSTSSPSNKISQLFLWDQSQQAGLALSLETRASRCAWSADSENIYCADGGTFSVFNTARPGTGPKTLISDPIAGLVEELLLDGAEEHLIFRTQTGKLYGFNLNQ